MIKNEQKIKQIIMRPKAICYCPLGNDWYTNNFKISFFPDKTFPDYCDIEKYLNENIRGKKLIIEDAINILYQYLQVTYQPKELQVVSEIYDAESHSPVTVIK